MKLKIYFANSQNSVRVTLKMKLLVRRAIENTLYFEDFHRDAEVSVTFTDDSGIRRLNKKFRGKDRSTDVLSFPLLTEGTPAVPGMPAELGDIVLSLERVRAQGEEYGHGFFRELCFLVIHSTLHLLGYDHETGEADELDMRARQTAIAAVCGYPVKNNEVKETNE